MNQTNRHLLILKRNSLYYIRPPNQFSSASVVVQIKKVERTTLDVAILHEKWSISTAVSGASE